MARFSQLPTLGEFVRQAKKYGWKWGQPITVPGFGKIRYLVLDRSKEGLRPAILDLQAMPEHQRLARHQLESFCERTGVPREDFGLTAEHDE